MNRKNKFLSFKYHSWLNKIYKKCSKEEIKMALNFIELNDSLSKDDFEIVLNRLFLNKEKTKHWKEISELLSCSNCQ